MDYDMVKVEETVLALLGVFEFEFEHGCIWKRYEFAVMDRLYEKGLITQPKGRQESIHLTEEGLRRAKEFAAGMQQKSWTGFTPSIPGSFGTREDCESQERF